MPKSRNVQWEHESLTRKCEKYNFAIFMGTMFDVCFEIFLIKVDHE